MDKTKLKKLLTGLTNYDSGLGNAFKSVEKELMKVSDELWQKAEVRTAENAKKKIDSLKGDLDKSVKSMLDSFEGFKKESGESNEILLGGLENKLREFKGLIDGIDKSSKGGLDKFETELSLLTNEIKEIGGRKVVIPDFKKDIDQVEVDLSKLISSLRKDVEEGDEKLEEKIDELDKDFKDLRRDVMKVSGSHGGGNANRNISVNSNPSTLSRYTDLNIRAGTNITLSYTNNDNLHTTDLTIASSGGAGTSRSISTVSVSSVVSSVASTDHVIIADQGILLTMPTAVSNTNLYTIKNVAASSVMVRADGAETIDGSANIILTTQYTAVDLISDSANWHVT